MRAFKFNTEIYIDLDQVQVIGPITYKDYHLGCEIQFALQSGTRFFQLIPGMHPENFNWWSEKNRHYYPSEKARLIAKYTKASDEAYQALLKAWQNK